MYRFKIDLLLANFTELCMGPPTLCIFTLRSTWKMQVQTNSASLRLLRQVFQNYEASKRFLSLFSLLTLWYSVQQQSDAPHDNEENIPDLIDIPESDDSSSSGPPENVSNGAFHCYSLPYIILISMQMQIFSISTPRISTPSSDSSGTVIRDFSQSPFKISLSHLADVSTQGESPAAAAVINEATTALRDGHRYHSVHNNQLEALWRSTDADTDVQL